MTHQGIPAEIRKQLDIDNRLIRLSVIIENIDNIITDLIQAWE